MDLCEEGLNLAEKCMGSELSILATEESRQELLNLNDGELPSVVFDATGNKQSMINTFDYVARCLRKGLLERLYITNKTSFNEVCAFFDVGDFRSNTTLVERELFFSRMEINRLSKNKKYGNYL